jgi:hypothetical protein
MDELVQYDVAKLAKEKGFNNSFGDGRIYGWYGKVFSNGKPDDSYGHWNLDKELIARPTQFHLQTWLRKEYNIHVEVNCYYNPSRIEDKLFYEFGISTKENSFEGFMYNISHRYKTKDLYYRIREKYEQALEEGLLEGLKEIK